jgi:hypothetical protein
MNIVTNIRSVAKKINYFIKRTPEAARSVLEDTALRIQTRMNVRQEKSDYPVTWDSERQRRAFFATDGFGHGIPYQRTGATKWTIDKSFANEVQLFAPHPAGPVFGRMPDGAFWQSKIHRKTWPELQTVLSEELEKLPRAIMASLKVLFESDEAP